MGDRALGAAGGPGNPTPPRPAAAWWSSNARPPEYPARLVDQLNPTPESAQASLSAALSLALRLVGRDADPARSRDHVLLSVLAERHLHAGRAADLSTLLHDLADPLIDEVGALPIDQFLAKTERRTLAAALSACAP